MARAGVRRSTATGENGRRGGDGFDIGDPKRCAVRCGKELNVAALRFWLNYRPLPLSRTPARRSDSISAPTKIIHIMPRVYSGSRHHAGRGLTSEDVDAVVQVAVAGGLGGARAAGQALHQPRSRNQRSTSTAWRNAPSARSLSACRSRGGGWLGRPHKAVLHRSVSGRPGGATSDRPWLAPGRLVVTVLSMYRRVFLNAAATATLSAAEVVAPTVANASPRKAASRPPRPSTPRFWWCRPATA